MSTVFVEKRRRLLLLHCIASAVTSACLLSTIYYQGFGWNVGALVLLSGWLAAFSSRSAAILAKPAGCYLFATSVALSPCVLAFAVGLDPLTFCVPWFAAVIVCAAADSLRRTLLLGFIVIACYPLLTWLRESSFEPVNWLALVALAGWTVLLATVARLDLDERERSQAEATFTSELFEFGKAIAKSDDPDLILRIPRMIADILGADICEMAMVEDERIVRRILPNRHSRDFCNIDIHRSVHERALGTTGVYATAEMQEDSWFRQKEDFSLYPYRTYVAKAWFSNGRPVGLMAIYRDKKNLWNEQERKKFVFLVDQSVLALQNARLRKELEAQASSDGLTGLANHRYFYERIDEEFARAERRKHPFTIVMIDLDFFKKMNDTAGHKVGDAVLQQLASLLRASVRRMDLAARLGGDEFALALPETTAADAFTLCDRILQGARKLRVGPFSGFSLSIGCASYPADGATLHEVIEHADQALYHSKHLGRGRVSKYSDLQAADQLTG